MNAIWFSFLVLLLGTFYCILSRYVSGSRSLILVFPWLISSLRLGHIVGSISPRACYLEKLSLDRSLHVSGPSSLAYDYASTLDAPIPCSQYTVISLACAASSCDENSFPCQAEVAI